MVIINLKCISYIHIFITLALMSRPNNTSGGVTKTKIVKSFIIQIISNWYLWKAKNEAYTHNYILKTYQVYIFY